MASDTAISKMSVSESYQNSSKDSCTVTRCFRCTITHVILSFPFFSRGSEIMTGIKCESLTTLSTITFWNYNCIFSLFVPWPVNSMPDH